MCESLLWGVAAVVALVVVASIAYGLYVRRRLRALTEAVSVNQIVVQSLQTMHPFNKNTAEDDDGIRLIGEQGPITPLPGP